MSTPGKCSVCHHSDRHRIELLRLGGAGLEALSRKFGVSRDSIWRHFRKHVSDDARANLMAGPVRMHELAEKAAAEGLSLLDYLALMRSVLMNQFMACGEAGDAHNTALLAGKLQSVLVQIGRISGELAHVANSSVSVTHNTLIINSPEFVTLQARLLQALAPFPDARVAVVAALRELDEQRQPVRPVEPLVIEHTPEEVT